MLRFASLMVIVGFFLLTTSVLGTDRLPQEILGVWYVVRSDVNQDRLKASPLSDAQKMRYATEEPRVVKESRPVGERIRFIFEKSGAYRCYVPCCGSTDIEEGRWKVVDYGANREVHTIEVTLRRNDPTTKKPAVEKFEFKLAGPDRGELTPLVDGAVHVHTVERVRRQMK